MDIELVDFRSKEITHVVRVLSPLGHYSNREIILEKAGYFPDPQISLSIFPHRVAKENAPYSEMQWLYEEEIRLYAAIAMGLDPDEGSLALYPCHHGHVFLNLSKEKMNAPDFKSTVRNLVIDKFMAENESTTNFYYSSIFPWSHKIKYVLSKKNMNYSLVNAIYNSIDVNDAILMRGLSTFLKSGMLKQHCAFYEEGINSLFISLEASFRLILKRLKQNGILNPTSKDAAIFLHDSFHDTERLENYFEEYYQQRVISLHPESRHGVYPYPPLQVDDLYFLYSGLLEVYRFLIVGYIHPKHLKKNQV